MAEPIQHPITMLSFFTEHTARWLAEVSPAAAVLEEGRSRPYLLADTDVTRIQRVYTEQGEHLDHFTDHARRWRTTPGLTTQQLRDLDRLDDHLRQLRALNVAVLALADELATGTIDTLMRACDLELGLATLLGDRHR